MKHPREQLGFTAGGLADSIQSPRRQVDLAIRTGDLKAIRSGRRFIILRQDADDWLRRCRERGEIPTPVTPGDREKFAELNRARREEHARRKREREAVPSAPGEGAA